MANALAYYALAEVLESIRNRGQKPHLNGLALPLNNRLGCFFNGKHVSLLCLTCMKARNGITLEC
jgi:hypothetical protein